MEGRGEERGKWERRAEGGEGVGSSGYRPEGGKEIVRGLKCGEREYGGRGEDHAREGERNYS